MTYKTNLVQSISISRQEKMIGNFIKSNSLADQVENINEDKEIELSSGEEQVD